MKQKLRNLSAQANIIFAILAVFIFIAPLQWSGKVLGLIPGMEKTDDYLLQAMVETVVLVIFPQQYSCLLLRKKCLQKLL